MQPFADAEVSPEKKWSGNFAASSTIFIIFSQQIFSVIESQISGTKSFFADLNAPTILLTKALCGKL